jgi:hypothetical protein
LILVCIVGFLVVVGIIAGNSGTNKPGSDNSRVGSEAPAQPPSPTWTYDETTDSMTGKITHIACLDSEDQLQFGFPYDGGSTGSICLRKGKQTDAFFKIDKGQVLCGVDGCEATLRVDGGEPFRVSGSESNDGDSRYMFFNSYQRIFNIAKKAKEIKIEVLYYQEGKQTLTFAPGKPLDAKW